MGIVNFSIPKDLVLKILDFKEIDNFIETGTYKGATSFWAAQHFKKVYTIEINEEISKETASKVDCPKNIEFLIGNSKDVLPELVDNKLSGTCFFWLDGHWCMGAGGKEEECPLIDELEAIKLIQNAIIFIDDARCFLGPLPPPHDSSHWPRIDQIFIKISQLFPDHRFTIQDDVIMVIPLEYMAVLDEDWKSKFQVRFSTKKKLSFLGRITKKIKSL
ncbi:hypothetical protein LV84_04185 [Algoriphagus ratkowskyi]|uniref:Class I SAM-dependent methyltransferase n=1 Tax=Algoriphagus ratkowskyi TaxID=57028 RepID=A0A2W7QMV5_9BACT|nr:class I SAM-dependent methyltransferase [Algoriphagus ratkowskyi]PZX49793.1 hypothetical protein LV84_04185 [Algoriphagus ratkowskyi]TXD75487.1 class I SAM-dependent methyltransferase [Algoriphagus ratkowskyi]